MAFNFGGAKNGAEKQQGGETKGHFDEKIIMGDLIDLGALVPMKHLVVDQEVRLDCSTHPDTCCSFVLLLNSPFLSFAVPFQYQST